MERRCLSLGCLGAEMTAEPGLLDQCGEPGSGLPTLVWTCPICGSRSWDPVLTRRETTPAVKTVEPMCDACGDVGCGDFCYFCKRPANEEDKR